MRFSPKPPPDAPAPSQNEPLRHADEPDIEDSDDVDSLDPKVSALVELLGADSLLAEDEEDDDLLLMMMRSMPERRSATHSRRTLH